MIILAFPSTGKTWLTHHQGGYVDLDYDFFRRAGEASGLGEKTILKNYAKVAERYSQEGWKVLVNEPAIIRMGVKVRACYVPSNWSRACIRLGVDKETCANYIADWKVAAAKFHIPCFTIDGHLAAYVRCLK